MVSKKSLEESEKNAKVWMVDAVNERFDSLDKQLLSIDNRLAELGKKSETQVTPQQLTDNITALRSDFSRQMEESEEKQNIKIANLGKDVNQVRKDMNRFTWIVISTGVSIIGVAITIILRAGNA